VLSRVLDGPVDISDLWASRASLTEQASADDASHASRTSGYSHEASSFSQGSGATSEDEGCILGSALTGSSVSDSGSEGVGGAGGHAGGTAVEYDAARGWLGPEEGSEEWQLSESLTFASGGFWLCGAAV
jgi:hypothetical protein